MTTTPDESKTASTLGSDIIAGLTTGVANIPDAMASAILAGANPVQGLYAIMIGTPLGALFGSSAFMTVCATSAMAITAGTALAAYAGEQHYTAIATLAFLTGLVMVLAGLLKLGRLLRFVSNSVLVGFLTGVSITVILSQLGDFTGYSSEYSNKVVQAFDLLLNLNQVNPHTTVIGLLTVATILLVDRTPLGKFSMLIGMVAGTAALLLTGWTDVQQVSDIADIPSSLPLPRLPDLSMLLTLLPVAISLSIIGLVQGAGVSKAYPNPDGTYPDTSRDFIGQGVANIGSGLLQGIPIGGSVSSTALNVSSGAQSRMSNVFAGLLVVVVILLLSGLVGLVAMPAMAALLIVAGYQSIKWAALSDVWDTGWSSRLVMLATLILTLIIPLQYAVLAGVILSVVAYVIDSVHDVDLRQVVESADGGYEEQAPPATLPSEEVTLLTMYGDLFFAAADRVEQLLPDPAGSHRPVVILDFHDRVDISSTFITVLERYETKLRAVEGKLILSGVTEDAKRQLDRTETTSEWLGEEDIFMAEYTLSGSAITAYRSGEAWLASAENEPLDQSDLPV